MTRLVRTLSDRVQAEARRLQEIGSQVVRTLHDLGNRLLAALTLLAAPVRPTPDGACAGGQTARSLRMQSGAVITVLGHVMPERATDILAALAPQRAKCEGVTDAMRSFTTHQARVDDPPAAPARSRSAAGRLSAHARERSVRGSRSRT